MTETKRKPKIKIYQKYRFPEFYQLQTELIHHTCNPITEALYNHVIGDYVPTDIYVIDNRYLGMDRMKIYLENDAIGYIYVQQEDQRILNIEIDPKYGEKFDMNPTWIIGQFIGLKLYSARNPFPKKRKRRRRKTRNG